MDVCKLDDFKRAFEKLDIEIDKEIKSGDKELEELSPLIVKAIGGFALLYHELRIGAVTADIDSTVGIPSCYKKIIKRVGKELDIPEDWLNDHSKSDMALVEGKWESISWKLRHIQVYVLNTRELMLDKCGWAERNLSGNMLTDRDDVKDLNDFLGILWKLGIRYSNIDELRTELSKFNFDIDDYPNVKQYIENDLNDDDIIWSEKTIK